MQNKALSQIEITEIRNRTRGLRDDELDIVLKNIPTVNMLQEISRREALIMDNLTSLCSLFDDLTVDKPIAEMDILEKEDVLKQLRRCLYYAP